MKRLASLFEDRQSSFGPYQKKIGKWTCEYCNQEFQQHISCEEHKLGCEQYQKAKKVQQLELEEIESVWIKLNQTGSIESDGIEVKLKRKSSDSLNSTQENFKKRYCENRDMSLDNVQDIMIEQGCENDEKTSNSSILSAFFQPT